MTSNKYSLHRQWNLIRSDEMDFFDWLAVLFSFATALYVMFDGGGESNKDASPLIPGLIDDEARWG